MATRTFQVVDPSTDGPFEAEKFKDYVFEQMRSGMISVSAVELFNELAKRRGNKLRAFELTIREIHFGERPQMIATDKHTHQYCLLRLTGGGVYLEVTE